MRRHLAASDADRDGADPLALAEPLVPSPATAGPLPPLSTARWIVICRWFLCPSHSVVKVRALGKQRRVGGGWGGAGGAEEGLIRPDWCCCNHLGPCTAIPLDPIHLMLCEIIPGSPEK